MKIPSYKYKFKQIFKKIGQPKAFDPSGFLCIQLTFTLLLFLLE